MTIATTSTCSQKHGAIIVKGGSVIAVGVNRMRNDPKTVESNFSTHAEIAALRSCSDVDLKNATVYIARVNRAGKPMLSAPCEDCASALLARGVKKIVYTW